MAGMGFTTAGFNRLQSSGTQFTHAQFSTVEVDQANIAGATTLTGVQATVPVVELIEGAQTNYIAIDEDDNRAYTAFRTVGVWSGEPGQSGSILMHIESTGRSGGYGDKVLNQNLRLSGSMLLSNAQLANVTLTTLQVGAATTSRAGIVQLATQSEVSGASGSGVVTADRIGDIDLADLDGQVTAAQVPSLDASKIATGVFDADRIPDKIQVLYTVSSAPNSARTNLNQTVTLSSSMANFSQLLVAIDHDANANNNDIATSMIPVAMIPTTSMASAQIDTAGGQFRLYGSTTSLTVALGHRDRHIISVVGIP